MLAGRHVVQAGSRQGQMSVRGMLLTSKSEQDYLYFNFPNKDLGSHTFLAPVLSSHSQRSVEVTNTVSLK